MNRRRLGSNPPKSSTFGEVYILNDGGAYLNSAGLPLIYDGFQFSPICFSKIDWDAYNNYAVFCATAGLAGNSNNQFDGYDISQGDDIYTEIIQINSTRLSSFSSSISTLRCDNSMQYINQCNIVKQSSLCQVLTIIDCQPNQSGSTSWILQYLSNFSIIIIALICCNFWIARLRHKRRVADQARLATIQPIFDNHVLIELNNLHNGDINETRQQYLLQNFWLCKECTQYSPLQKSDCSFCLTIRNAKVEVVASDEKHAGTWIESEGSWRRMFQNINLVNQFKHNFAFVRRLNDDFETLEGVPPNEARPVPCEFNLRLLSSLDFSHKLQWFREINRRNQIPWELGHVKIELSRKNILNDAMNAFSQLNHQGDFNKIFQFTFLGEQGRDAGGLAREFFSLITKFLFDLQLGVFTYSQLDNCTYQINPHSEAHCEFHLDVFYFAGQFMAKALIDGQLIDAHLCLPFYKHLLALPITLADMEFVDEEVHKNMAWLRANEVSDSLNLDFTVTESMFGDAFITELCEGGKDIEVNNDNKERYIELTTRYKLLGSISKQLTSFLKGFYGVLHPSYVYIFGFQELELLLCGLPEINIDDWMINTEYSNGYSISSSQIGWFWEIIKSFSQEQRARLLQFVTGTSRVPITGFVGLQGKNGAHTKFHIKRIERTDSNGNPVAHTCFNRLDLPAYKSIEEQRHALECVIQMELLEGFTIE